MSPRDYSMTLKFNGDGGSITIVVEHAFYNMTIPLEPYYLGL